MPIKLIENTGYKYDGTYRFYGFEHRDEIKPVKDCGVKTIGEFYLKCLKAWSVETCSVRFRPDWSEDNPSVGQCTITAADATFPASVPGNYHPATHGDMTFQGTLVRTGDLSTNNYGYKDGFFVQSGGAAHVNPFRCYFTCNPAAGAPQNLPATLFIDCSDNSPMGIGDVENTDRQNSIRYSNDVYDLMGRLVRKNAENLEGLPKGVYIWRGKKVLQFQ